MHLLPICLGLFVAAGGVLSLPVKGGEKKENGSSGQWVQPKDWDWSVTTSTSEKSSTSRLIPVYEATDDVPTPGYKMSDLQQKVIIVPSVIAVNQAVLNSKAAYPLPSRNNPPIDDRNEEGLLQSLDNPQKISVIKEIIPLETTENQEADLEATTENKEPKEKERVPVEEAPMVKVTLPEYCSISGLGCRDRPRTPTSHKDQHTPDEIQTENSSKKESTEQSSTTLDIAPTTFKSDQKDAELTESNQQPESTDSTPNNQVITGDQVPEKLPSENTPTNTDNNGNSQEQKQKPEINQEKIEEAIIQKVEDIDNFQQNPAYEEKLDDQLPIGSSAVEDQKPLGPIFKPEQDNKEESKEPIQKPISSIEENDDSSEENNSQSREKEKMSSSLDKEASEEEKKLIQTVSFESDHSTTEQSKDEQTESLSLGERITGYWRAATGFVSRHIGL